MSDKHTQQAIIMNLVILGEAATKIMEHYRGLRGGPSAYRMEKHEGDEEPGSGGYFDINLDVVWDTARSAIPTLYSDLTNLSLECDS